MKYIKLFEEFDDEVSSKLDHKQIIANKYCKLIAGPFLEKNPDWENMPLIADDFFNSLLRIENVITGDKARCYLHEVVPITEEEWKLLERIQRLKEFFKSGATGEESQKIIAIYKHFKSGGSIDDLEPSLKNLYKEESPGIFNFSNFTKEQFMEIVKELAKDNSSFRDYIDEDDDTPSFDISSKGSAFNMR